MKRILINVNIYNNKKKDIGVTDIGLVKPSPIIIDMTDENNKLQQIINGK